MVKIAFYKKLNATVCTRYLLAITVANASKAISLRGPTYLNQTSNKIKYELLDNVFSTYSNNKIFVYRCKSSFSCRLTRLLCCRCRASVDSVKAKGAELSALLTVWGSNKIYTGFVFFEEKSATCENLLYCSHHFRCRRLSSALL